MHKINPLELIEEIYKEHYVYLRNFLIGLTKSDEVKSALAVAGALFFMYAIYDNIIVR
ncbi:hypothetical protein [Halobacillus amylolyticus]|uniref:Uncharacterized protein n=1 Tax=Halobacillus amylolyticus TaxID=2932259 RepID=A0ABY4H994_9BACI|nr:hypothetical protein [Halobacillus amylolyticus]UOR11116.1 hypothetical protein MUO15_16160 [Halobacillus amylolyticus]